jgi:hypothetical protein
MTILGFQDFRNSGFDQDLILNFRMLGFQDLFFGFDLQSGLAAK